MENTNRVKDRVRDIMQAVNGRCLFTQKVSNGTELEFWQVGSQVVIMQYFPNNSGCTHYVQGTGNTWGEMQTQLENISKG